MLIVPSLTDLILFLRQETIMTRTATAAMMTTGSSRYRATLPELPCGTVRPVGMEVAGAVPPPSVFFVTFVGVVVETSGMGVRDGVIVALPVTVAAGSEVAAVCSVVVVTIGCSDVVPVAFVAAVVRRGGGAEVTLLEMFARS